MNNVKILFLYSQLTPVGYQYTRMRKLIDALRDEYEVETRFAIVSEQKYAEINNEKVKNEFITTKDFVESEFDLLFIEGSLYVKNEHNSYRTDAHIYKGFLDQGGLIIYNFDDSTSYQSNPGKDAYHSFLVNAGFPTIRNPTSENEFPHLHGGIRDNDIIYGFDEDAAVSKGSSYIVVNVTESYLDSVPSYFRAAYLGVSRLILGLPIQVMAGSQPLIFGNPTTKLLTSGDWWWDGDFPIFGCYNSLGYGCSVLIAAHMFLDSLLEKYSSDNIQFLKNLVNVLTTIQQERRNFTINPVQDYDLFHKTKIQLHPNISILIRRMQNSLRQQDYPGVIHASASIMETLAKDVVGIDSVQNQTLKSFFERYRKESNLPEELLNYILSIYDFRNTTPLAGHGSKAIPGITKKQAVVLFEITLAIVRIEYQLK